MKSSTVGQGNDLDQGVLPPCLPSASGGFHASARMRQRSALLWQQIAAESRRFSPMGNPPLRPDDNIFSLSREIINKKQKQNCVSLLRPYERTRKPIPSVRRRTTQSKRGLSQETLIYHSSIPLRSHRESSGDPRRLSTHGYCAFDARRARADRPTRDV